jgi:hypothetical protein
MHRAANASFSLIASIAIFMTFSPRIKLLQALIRIATVMFGRNQSVDSHFTPSHVSCRKLKFGDEHISQK